MARFSETTITKTEFDMKTGEASKETEKQIKVEKKDKVPEYVMLFKNSEHLDRLSGTQIRIIIEITRLMEMDSCEIDLSTAARKRITKKLGTSMSTFRSALVAFIKNGILIRSDDGVFIVSPLFAFRGQLKVNYKFRQSLYGY
nr:replication/maintenance protein RepL [Alteromonas alba]